MHGKKLGINEAFLYKLVPVVGHIMESYYPEVLASKDFIQKVVKNEENRFHETINEGLEILNTTIEETKAAGKKELAGDDIFRLYDTFGFPVELTEEVAEDEGLTVDHKGFEEAMEAQRNRARAARSDEKSMGVQSGLLTDVKVESKYVGYDTLEATSELVLLIQDEEIVSKVSTGSAQVIFKETPFYAEMGGQVADTGDILDENGKVVAHVVDVKRAPNGQHLHSIEVISEMSEGKNYQLVVDKGLHRRIIKNHTVTHLLHRALKDVLGNHANQAGSLVAPEHLRFDFTHFGQVTKEELEEMERIVNEKIWAAIPVETIETDLETAKEMGAMALFGEKYGHDVRVVNIGGYSIELCGGNHVKNTEEIGAFKIIAESGIGAGTRRIEAVTSKEAYEAFKAEQKLLQETASLVKSPQAKDTPTKVAQLQESYKELQKENQQLSQKLANIQAANIFDEKEEINGKTLIAKEVNVKDMNQLRQLADEWKQKQASDLLVLAAQINDKVNLLVAATKELNQAGIKAGDIIKELAPLVGGGGGGRPDMAQAGGKNPAGIKEVLQKSRNYLN